MLPGMHEYDASDQEGEEEHQDGAPPAEEEEPAWRAELASPLSESVELNMLDQVRELEESVRRSKQPTTLAEITRPLAS